MKLEHISPAALTLWADNTREHSEENILEIARVLTKHGFLDPVGIAADNRVVFGNGRVAAALKLGLDTIPCLRLPATLSETQLREIQIAHNRLAEKSSWDKNLLYKELSELAQYGVDLSDIGFSASDIDQLSEEIAQFSEGLDTELEDLGGNSLLFGEETNDLGPDSTDFDDEDDEDLEMGGEDMEDPARYVAFKVVLPPEDYEVLNRVLNVISKKHDTDLNQSFMILVGCATVKYQ